MHSSKLTNAIERNLWLKDGPKFRGSVFSSCKVGLHGDTKDWSLRKETALKVVLVIRDQRVSGKLNTHRYPHKEWVEHARNALDSLSDEIFIVFSNYQHLGAFRSDKQSIKASLECLLDKDGDTIFLSNENMTKIVCVDYDDSWPESSLRYEVASTQEIKDS